MPDAQTEQFRNNAGDLNLRPVCLLGLFGSSAFWLAISSVFWLIGSIKFHSPDFLADSSWLTYGHVRAASTATLQYGFCLPAGLGIALWILSHVGKTPLVFPAGALLGTILLNIGTVLNVVGVLSGALTGFESFEVPGYAAIFILLGYMSAGVCAALTLHSRNHPGLTVPEWYLLAAIFWFPWVFSTAHLLVVAYPIRGIAQAVIAWWYGANFQLVWVGLTGLAAVFFILPRQLGRESNSRYLALFAFWILVLFGSWTGVPQTAPVPAWIPAISTVATVLTSLFFLAVLLSVWDTSGGQGRSSWRGAAGFVSFAVCALLLAGAAGILPVVFGCGDLIAFTWLGVARSQLLVYGFFAVAAFGCVYSLLGEFEGAGPDLPRLARAQFWLASSGVLLSALPLAGAGILQGIKLQNPDIAFVETSKATLHFLRLATVGDLLIVAANSLLLFSIVSFAVRSVRARARTALSEATTEVPR